MFLHIFLPSFVESQNFYSLSETYTIRCSSLPKFWWHHPDPCLLLFLTWINPSLFPRRRCYYVRTYCYAAFGSLTFGPDDTLTSVGKTSSSDASSNCDCILVCIEKIFTRVAGVVLHYYSTRSFSSLEKVVPKVEN